MDGHFKYSKVCIISPDNSADGTTSLCPIPATGLVNIAFDSQGRGQLLREQSFNTINGRQTVSLKVNDLPKRVYLLKLMTGEINRINTFFK